MEVGGAYGTNEGDVKAWGRNWHETVILSGIEMQRQRVRETVDPGMISILTTVDGQGIQRAIPTENAGQLGVGKVKNPPG
jgi:hypothetical protein